MCSFRARPFIISFYGFYKTKNFFKVHVNNFHSLWSKAWKSWMILIRVASWYNDFLNSCWALLVMFLLWCKANSQETLSKYCSFRNELLLLIFKCKTSMVLPKSCSYLEMKIKITLSLQGVPKLKAMPVVTQTPQHTNTEYLHEKTLRRWFSKRNIDLYCWKVADTFYLWLQWFLAI